MLEKFIRRPVLSLVISIFITLLGVLSLFTIPITQFPDIVPPSVVVTANYTGANAEVATDAVAIPLERAINGVAGMTYMSSVSTNNGTTLIQVFFNVGVDPDIAAVNVQNRVTTVLDELPEEVIKAGVTTEKEVNSMLMYLNIFSEDATADERFIYNFTDINILKELKRIEGVGFVEIMGLRDYAMRVWLKPDRMAAYQVSGDEVIEAIRAQNVEAAPGQTGIGSDKSINMQQYVLRYPGKFTDEADYLNIPIRANADGSILRVRDIADVEFGSLDYEMVSKTDGRPSASIMMKQLPGSNAQEVINNVKSRMAELQQTSFPPGMQYTMSYDVSRFLDASINEVIKTLLEAFLLVFLIVFIFLQDFRSTLIPALAVPVCLIGAIFFMQIMGFSINLLTLFALVLAIGIVVDNAIVVVEAVHVKMEEEHLPPLEATIAAMKEIGGAVIAITLVMSAVFIPVAFLSGPVGIFYRQFSLTLASAIIISGINALTLTPALCALIMKSPHDKPKKNTWLNRFFKRFNQLYNKTSSGYSGLISRIAGRRTVTLGLLAVFFVATWGMTSVLPSGFIPTEDQGMIYVNVTTPPGATVERTEAALDEIDSIARMHEAVETVSTLSGYSLVNEVSGASYGMGMINLRGWDEREESIYDIIQYLEENTGHILDAQVEYFPPPTVPGFGNSSGFELRFVDRTGREDLGETSTVLSSFLTQLQEAPEIGSAFTSFDPSFPQYLIQVDYDMAAKKGISVENAMNTLQTMVGSFYATNFIRYGQMYKLMVQAGPEYREKPEDILNLFIKNDAGEMVPYSAFVSLERIYGPEQLTRYNMFTSAMINGDAAEGYSSGQAIEAVERIAASTLPQGFDIEWSGMTREQILSGNQAVYIFALCLLFVYLLLAAQYESFLLPLPVILSLPAGVFGAFFFLWILGLENNIYAQVAMVMLIGLLGKNAILIIEYAILKQKQGATFLQAAVEGSVARLRPILMTSFAFIGGLIPLAMASGAGALGNRSIGTTAIGGMLIGTIVGVIVIPGLYVLVTSRSKKKNKIAVQGKPLMALILGASLLLAGCSVPREINNQQHRPLPESFAGHSEATLTLGNPGESTGTLSDQASALEDVQPLPTWDTFFDDPNLIALIEQAISRHPDMEIALQQIEIARANLRMKRSASIPSIDALAEAGLRKYGFYTPDGIGNYDTNFSENLKDDEKLPNPLPDYFIGLQASWEIDLWGKLKHKRRAAYQQFLSSYEGRKMVQTALVAEVAQSYFALIAKDNELVILDKNIGLQQNALEAIQVQREVGFANELGVSQFKAMLLNSKGKREDILLEIASLQHHINFLTGSTHGVINRATLDISIDLPALEAMPMQVLAFRPDIRQASLDLLASNAKLRAAKAEFLPSLVLSPYIGFQSFDLSKLLMSPTSLAYGLLGGVTAPLLNKRTIRTAYEIQRAHYGIDFQQYEKTVLAAWKEINEILDTGSYLDNKLEFLQQESAILVDAIDIANELFFAGQANYLDIITTQRTALEAEINLVQGKLDQLQTRVALYRALGGGWE